jgi:uncharacterized protein (DUF3820 family)
MPFGEHRDKLMEDVPARYLLYLRELWKKSPPSNRNGKNVSEYIEANLTALCKEDPDYIP